MIFVVVSVLALVISITIICIITPLAVNIGLVDNPGGHKLHQGSVPIVGGFAIYLSLLAAWAYLPIFDYGSINAIFLASSGMLFTLGLLDDRYKLSVAVRLIMQVVAALLLVYSNVVIKDFGALLSDDILVTGIFAIPLTVIATVGTINSMNMIDGIDGLVGVVSVVILTLIIFVSCVSNSEVQLLIGVCVLGSVIGFLLFNLRRPGFKKATVFMGDAGSTLLGFVFAYLLISLSQGEERAMTPVTALWVFAVPLMDVISVIIRRIRRKISPFKPDRGHLHHLLLDAGYRTRHVVYFIATAQLLLGIFGVMGYYLGVPDKISFLLFISILSIYAYITTQSLRVVKILHNIHRAFGLVVRDGHHLYIGNLNEQSAVVELENLLGEDKCKYSYKIYKGVATDVKRHYVFAVIDVKETDNIKQCMVNMKKRLRGVEREGDIEIRQYIMRSGKDIDCNQNHLDKYIYRIRNTMNLQMFYNSEIHAL